jgi:hypothetical protein
MSSRNGLDDYRQEGVFNFDQGGSIMKNAIASCAVLAFVALISTSMVAIFQGMTYNPDANSTRVFYHFIN